MQHANTPVMLWPQRGAGAAPTTCARFHCSSGGGTATCPLSVSTQRSLYSWSLASMPPKRSHCGRPRRVPGHRLWNWRSPRAPLPCNSEVAVRRQRSVVTGRPVSPTWTRRRAPATIRTGGSARRRTNQCLQNTRAHLVLSPAVEFAPRKRSARTAPQRLLLGPLLTSNEYHQKQAQSRPTLQRHTKR